MTGHFPSRAQTFWSLAWSTSFAEASFFPIPPDVLLLPLCLGNLKKFFALICSVASVLGGLAGYAIGAFAWDGWLLGFSNMSPGFEEKFTRLQDWYTSGLDSCLSSRFFSYSLQNFYHC